MKARRITCVIEPMEQRQLLSWSSYAQLVHQDVAAADYSNITGAGVTVAVIDTGIDYNLPALGGGIGAGHMVLGGYDYADNDPDPMDESGHGTSVAGVIAANPYTVNGVTYQGVAPDANLVALRVGTETNIPTTNIEKALRWVIDNYQNYHIKVVNLSLGSGSYPDPETDSITSDEFRTLHDLGIFVVAASGNSQDELSGPISQDGIAYPAADPNVFAVGAADSNDVITTWAQRGDELDLLAPGVNIVMPKMGGGTVTEDGTSFSSPYVAGTAALIAQEDPTAKAGDIGSILMASGDNNRDGDNESGNTTGLLFSRLDISAALALTGKRVGKYDSVPAGKLFDTALDSQGVLHMAYFDPVHGDLLYATRNTSGLWSDSTIVDSAGIVGSQMSIAVDATGKPGIAYFDNTNTDLKFAGYDNGAWTATTLDSSKHVGTSPSLAYDIDGNAYVAYYRRSSGDVKLASLNRDSGVWSRQTVDGTDGSNVGASCSLDVGEAAVRSQFGFTTYDTTVAVAYSDTTHGDLKYARIDIDNPQATWYTAVVDDTNGVSNVNLNLHEGPSNLGLQAQIAYRVNATKDVKYAFRNTDWFVETVATTGSLGSSLQLSFDVNNTPQVTYYYDEKHALYTSTRLGPTNWSVKRAASSAAPMSLSLNERTGEATLTYLNRARTAVFSNELL
jgi:hypothetical protein